MNVNVLNVYGGTYSNFFQNGLFLPTLTPQTVIFGFLDSASNSCIFKNNKVFINHIVLTLKLYVYKSREKKFINIKTEKETALSNSSI